jgi:DNA-binding NarL/FixJ family response regulator
VDSSRVAGGTRARSATIEARPLTVRVSEIVRNVAAGLRNTEIAERLPVTERYD